MGSAIISTILEKLHQKIRVSSPQTIMRGDGTAVEGIVGRIATAEKALLAAEKEGNVTEVEGEFKKELALHEGLALKLLDVLVQIRLILDKQLRLLVDAKTRLRRNPNIKEDERRGMEEKIDADIAKIKDYIDSVFKQLTSMDSINLALESTLKFDTLAQVEAGDYTRSRKVINRLLRYERQTDRDAGSEDEKRINEDIAAFTKNLIAELMWLAKDLNDTVQEFRNDLDDLKAEGEHMSRLIHEQSFPKEIGETLIAADERLLHHLRELIDEEVEKIRLELSKAEHAA